MRNEEEDRAIALADMARASERAEERLRENLRSLNAAERKILRIRFAGDPGVIAAIDAVDREQGGGAR